MPDDKKKSLSPIKTIELGKGKKFMVIGQPTGKDAFVSEKPDAVTAFSMAMKQGVYGFLAHNHKAGKSFSSIKVGQVVQLSHSDGKKQPYTIQRIEKFQALDPRNPRSKFINLKDKKQCSANDLFRQIYTGSRRLVLQTCIQKDGDEEWGRMFIIAEPKKDEKRRKPAEARSRRAIK